MEQDEAHLAELKKKRTFRKFSYRGVDLDQLLDMERYCFVLILETFTAFDFLRFNYLVFSLEIFIES